MTANACERRPRRHQSVSGREVERMEVHPHRIGPLNTSSIAMRAESSIFAVFSESFVTSACAWLLHSASLTATPSQGTGRRTNVPQGEAAGRAS
jgi:hypothetical protein